MRFNGKKRGIENEDGGMETYVSNFVIYRIESTEVQWENMYRHHQPIRKDLINIFRKLEKNEPKRRVREKKVHLRWHIRKY